MTEAEACLFCEIVAGKKPSSVVYEDEAVLAFLDLRQVTRGHSLVIPKRHIRDIFELDDEMGCALFAAVSRVAKATNAAIMPDGMSIWQSNVQPWQEILHLHFHIMPRHYNDHILRIYPQLPGATPRSELDEQAALIRGALSDVS